MGFPLKCKFIALIISVLKLSLLIFILLLLGGATIDYVERRRRSSDSAVYFNVKELPLSRLKCLETEVKYLHKDKKENLGSHPFEQNEIAPTGSPDKNFGKVLISFFEIIYSVDTVRPKCGCLFVWLVVLWDS